MMFKQFLLGVISLGLILAVNSAYAGRFGERYCGQPGFHCITVGQNQTWDTLFKNEHERDIVKRVNRINIRLYPGMRIAVPDNLSHISANDVSPLPLNIPAPGVKTVVIDQNELAWGAYNPSGELVKWGPISGGRSFCPDIGHSCRTISGEFTIYSERGAGCFSNKFPVGKGGAKMPYCMFFHGGYALHGSYEVPGYHASHGCVRLFISDAKWLNTEFVNIGSTKVIVRAVNPETEPAYAPVPRATVNARSVGSTSVMTNPQGRYPNRNGY